jgi:hypothetical protein
MYDFYYNKLLKECGRVNVDLCMTDTDSFIFKIKNNSAFDEKLSSFMDYSNYPSNHPLSDNSKKAQLGYFKDEITPDNLIREFVGLRSKCYALKMENEINNEITIKKTCKGLGKTAIKNRLRFSEYKKSLFEGKDVRHYYTGILSFKHDVFTTVRQKKALSCFDSKRHIFNCKIHSCPFGSSLIKMYNGKCFRCGY